jgi:hypothetical protein
MWLFAVKDASRIQLLHQGRPHGYAGAEPIPLVLRVPRRIYESKNEYNDRKEREEFDEQTSE